MTGNAFEKSKAATLMVVSALFFCNRCFAYVVNSCVIGLSVTLCFFGFSYRKSIEAPWPCKTWWVSGHPFWWSIWVISIAIGTGSVLHLRSYTVRTSEPLLSNLTKLLHPRLPFRWSPPRTIRKPFTLCQSCGWKRKTDAIHWAGL